MRPPRFRTVLANGLLLAAGLAVALLVAEMLVRRTEPQLRPLAAALHNLHVPDAELGYVMAPGFSRHVRTHTFECEVATNTLGLRDREIGPHRPARLRIVGLGDSFTLGLHAGALGNCYLKRLEATLRRQLANGATPGWDDVEVINAGVIGYGTSQEVGLLQRLGDALQPDAVLLAFFMGNDFTDNSGRTRMTVVDGYHMLEASADQWHAHTRPLHRRVRIYLNSHSELYVLAKQVLVQRLLARSGATPRSEATTAPHSEASAQDAHVQGPSAFEPFAYYRFDFGLANSMRAEITPDMAVAMEETRRALADLRTWCAARGVPALVVAIPAEEQVEAPARDAWLRRFHLEGEGLDGALPNRRLAALAKEARLPLYDLTDSLAVHIASGALLYIHGDGHWNAGGHAAAGELLVAPVLRYLVATAPSEPHAARTTAGSVRGAAAASAAESRIRREEQ